VNRCLTQGATVDEVPTIRGEAHTICHSYKKALREKKKNLRKNKRGNLLEGRRSVKHPARKNRKRSVIGERKQKPKSKGKKRGHFSEEVPAKKGKKKNC